MRVLVIDDSNTIRRSAELFLHQGGHEVLLADDGFDALAKVHDHAPDLIFCDILMPRLDGYQTCAIIKGHPRHAGMPVVMLSSKDGLFDRARMQGVIEGAGQVAAQAAEMSPEEAKTFLAQVAAQTQSEMPPRENQRINISLDSVHASGPSGRVHVVLNGTCNYKQTGLLQAYFAHALIHGAPRRTGFVSACQAFGHRELLAVLRAFGLMAAPTISGHVAPVATVAPASSFGVL